MTAALLIERFASVTDESDALADVRRFILDLAVRGKLAEQHAADESAAVVLERARKQCGQEGAERNGARGQPERPAEPRSYPYSAPNGWEWCLLGDIAQYGVAARVNSNADITDETWVLDLEDIEKESSRLIERRQSRERPFRSAKTKFEQGDVLFGKLRPYLNKVMVADQNGVCSSEIVPIRVCDGIVPEYLRIVLKSPLTMKRVDSLMYGMKMPRLGTGDARALPVPLPPVSEQHRIVAKVEELMALCDELQTAQVARDDRRDRFTRSSFQRLTQRRNAAEAPSQEDARFVLANMQRLISRPSDVALLRQTILRLALRGQLVPQDPREEPASELLASVRERRSGMLANGYPNAGEASSQLLKQHKQVAPKGLWRLPAGWQWTTLMQCSALTVDCHNKTAPYTSTGVLLLRTTNIRDGAINFKDARYVDEATYARWSSRCTPEPGDFLITREAPMGEVCIIPAGLRVCMGQRMMLLRLVPDTIEPAFMLMSLRDPDLMERVQDRPVGATVQHLRVGGVETLLVAVPPRAEQRRIVAKVDELMAICATLEAELLGAAEGKRHLLRSLLCEALGAAA